MKSIIFVAAILVSFVAARNDFECVPGVAYKENDCNICECIYDGAWACTRKQCPWSDEPREICMKTPREPWKDDCNDCMCSSRFGQICTNREC